MTPPVEQLTEALAIADKIAPTTFTASQAINSEGVDMQKFRRIMYTVHQGAGGLPTLMLQSAATSNFATPHTISGSVSGNTTTSGGITTLEVSAESVEDQNPGDRFVRLRIVNSGTDTLAGAICYGWSMQKPANLHDIATLERIVV